MPQAAYNQHFQVAYHLNYIMFIQLKLPQDPYPPSNYPTRATCILARPPTLRNFFESNLNSEGFPEVNGITVRVGTARGMSGIVTFGEKDVTFNFC